MLMFQIQYGQGRVGIYFLEAGANQLPSKVPYDRAYSSIALAKIEMLIGIKYLKS